MYYDQHHQALLTLSSERQTTEVWQLEQDFAREADTYAWNTAKARYYASLMSKYNVGEPEWREADYWYHIFAVRAGLHKAAMDTILSEVCRL